MAQPDSSDANQPVAGSGPGETNATDAQPSATTAPSELAQGFLLQNKLYNDFCLQVPSLNADPYSKSTIGPCTGAQTQIFRYAPSYVLAANGLCAEVPATDGELLRVRAYDANVQTISAILGFWDAPDSLFVQPNATYSAVIEPAGADDVPLANQSVVSRTGGDSNQTWLRPVPSGTDGFAIHWLGTPTGCAASRGGNVIIASCDSNDAGQRWQFSAGHHGLQNQNDLLSVASDHNNFAVMGRVAQGNELMLGLTSGIDCFAQGGQNLSLQLGVDANIQRVQCQYAGTSSGSWFLGER